VTGAPTKGVTAPDVDTAGLSAENADGERNAEDSAVRQVHEASGEAPVGIRIWGWILNMAPPPSLTVKLVIIVNAATDCYHL
jgi:hypothetical protein